MANTVCRTKSVFACLVAMAAASAFAAALPAGYKQCLCIYVTNENQYIDTTETGYLPKLATDVEAHFEVPDFSKQNPLYWTRNNKDNRSPSFAFVLTTNRRSVRAYRLSIGSSGNETALLNDLTTDIRLSTRYSGNGSVNTFTVNGETVKFPAKYLDELDKYIYIFRLNDNGFLNSGVKAVVGTKLYSFKLREGDVVKMNLVPCLRESDSVAGVYDTVSGKFLSNAASSGGSFGYELLSQVFEVSSSAYGVGSPSPAYGITNGLAAGATLPVSCGASPWTNSWGMIEYTCTGWKLYNEDDSELTNGTETAFTYKHPDPLGYRRLEWQWTSRKISNIPSGLVECECIVVNDNRQYINTLYKPKVTTDIEAHYEVPNFNSMNALYWARKTSSTSFGFILPANADNTKKVRAYRLTNALSSEIAVQNAPTTNLYISTEYSNGGAVNVFTLNGEAQNFAANDADSLDYEIYLFRLNDAGTLNVNSVPGTKLHSFKIIEDGVVVMDFVPCLRTADNVAGLYDILNEEPATAFYVNADTSGSGSFGYEAKAAGGTTLNVTGSPSQLGTPYPSYGITNLEEGVAINAVMPQIAVTNYLTGEERVLLGWTLSITRGVETITTTSTDLTRQTCSFTPQEGDNISLVWRWSPEQYGARTLPDEYEATDRLEITATDFQRWSFVDTKYIPSLDDQIVAAITPAGSTYFLFCSRESAALPAVKPQLRIYVNNGVLSYMCGTGANKDNLGSVTANARTTLAINGRGLYKDGAVVDARFGETDLDTTCPLTIGGGYTAYDSEAQRVYGIWYPFQGDIFAFKVWTEDGTPRVDLRPCTRKADGAKGLYDVVRNVFCPLRQNPIIWTSGDPYNLGTPTAGVYGPQRINISGSTSMASTNTVSYPAGEIFPAGGAAKFQVVGWTMRTVTAEGVETVVSNDSSNVSTCDIPIYYGDTIYFTWRFDVTYLQPAGPDLPQRYKEVEWMDFTNTYVKTDYTPHPNKIKMSTYFQLADTNLQCVFCARANVNSACYTTLIYPPGDPNHKQFEFRVKNTASDISFIPPVGERLTLCSEANTVWLKGKTEKYDVGTFDSSFTAAGGELVFGATYQIPSNYGNYSTMRFFGSKIWEKESGEYQLVHDYRPCFDSLTGASGLYDIVDGIFFPNEAGTHFAWGEKTYPETEQTRGISFPSAPALSAALDNFPVLVRFAENRPAGFLYDDCTNSACLWFEDEDGDALPCEIDTWNPEGESLAWVSVPSLSLSTKITMHWDNAGAPASVPASSEVWSRAKYVGVWHMNEILEDTSVSPATHYTPDSSASGWHAYKTMEADACPTPVTTATGVTANPTPLTGTAMNIAYGAGKSSTAWGGFLVPSDMTSSTTLNGPGFTLSAIVNSQQVANNGCCRVITFGDVYNDMANISVGRDNVYVMAGGNALRSNLRGATDWLHFAGVFGAKSYIYEDGVNQSGAGENLDKTNIALTKGIGLGCFTDKDGPLDGYVDEARIRNAQSSATWIAAEYATITDADFVKFEGLSFDPAAASDVTENSAVISSRLASLGPGATSADIWLVVSGGGATRTIPLGATNAAPAEISVPVRGLADGTVYTCWFTATNNAAMPVGADSDVVTFRTLKIPKGPGFASVLSFPSAPATPLENFPVLVRISEGAPSGFSYAECPQAGCLWFVDDEDVPLPSEVDTWNPSGESLVWVSVPSLSSATTIMMRWAKRPRQASFLPPPSTVWSLAGYNAVWHFNGSAAESVNGLAIAITKGTPTYEGSATYPGPLGKTIWLDGTSAIRYAPDPAWTTLGAGSALTLTCWSRDTNSAVNYGRMISSMSIWSNPAGYELTLQNSRTIVTVGSANSSQMQATISTASNAAWQHFAATYTNTTAALYANGSLVKSGTLNAVVTPTEHLVIGWKGGDGSQDTTATAWTGGIDEVRIRRATSSAAWIAEEYKTETMANYVSFGAVRRLPGVGGVFVVR